jgi:hypothetical protein
MGQEPFLDGPNWLLRTRRRRFRIGDLMVGIAVAAIGLSAISIPGLTGAQRLFHGAVTLLFLGLQWIQWGLASVRTNRSQPGKSVLLGILSSFLAVAMFVMLFVLGLAFPQGAALLSVMILIQVVYLTTWD